MIEPWEHGTVARSTEFPLFYDYNLLRVEAPDPGISAEDLLAAADAALAGLGHRRIDVDDESAGSRLRSDFKKRGFRAPRLVAMRWEVEVPADAPVMEETDAEGIRDLRLEWALHDAWEPDEQRTREFVAIEGEVYGRRGGRWLMHRNGSGEPIAFVLLLLQDGGAEIALAYCTPEHRGRGIGTSLLLSAVREARGCDDIWILADDEDRPKHLYRRLGFAPAWLSHEFTRIPPS